MKGGRGEYYILKIRCELESVAVAARASPPLTRGGTPVGKSFTRIWILGSGGHSLILLTHMPTIHRPPSPPAFGASVENFPRNEMHVRSLFFYRPIPSLSLRMKPQTKSDAEKQRVQQQQHRGQKRPQSVLGSSVGWRRSCRLSLTLTSPPSVSLSLSLSVSLLSNASCSPGTKEINRIGSWKPDSHSFMRKMSSLKRVKTRRKICNSRHISRWHIT